MNNLTHTLDNKAKTLAADYLRTEGELLSVLMEMRRNRIFPQLNASGIFDYCERILKLSKAQSYYFKSVAESSEKVPELKQAVVSGEITLSQARRIAPVVTRENHEQWIERARNLPQAELEKAVSKINPQARPREKIKPIAKKLSELRVPIDDITEANLVALKDILSQKLGHAASLAEVVAFAARVAREKFDPEEKAKRAKPVSLGKEKAPHKQRKPIPAAVKHEVIRRDGNQCSYVGEEGTRCPQRRWLDYHHLTPVSEGGTHTAQGIRLLCRSHHKALHDNIITLDGRLT